MLIVGQMFGNKPFQSFYYLLEDIKQALLTQIQQALPWNYHPLLTSYTLSHNNNTHFQKVPLDSHYPTLYPLELKFLTNARFVANYWLAAFLQNILTNLQQSMSPAYKV